MRNASSMRFIPFHLFLLQLGIYSKETVEDADEIFMSKDCIHSKVHCRLVRSSIKLETNAQ